MKLELFEYRCTGCGDIFRLPQLTGDVYGEFLLRDNKGNLAYLNTFKDKVFEEVKDIFLKELNLKTLDIDKARLFQKIFSVACDLSPSGDVYQIRPNLTCPECGSDNVIDTGPSKTSNLVDIDVQPVTHTDWAKLESSEKYKLIASVVSNNQ